MVRNVLSERCVRRAGDFRRWNLATGFPGGLDPFGGNDFEVRQRPLFVNTFGRHRQFRDAGTNFQIKPDDRVSNLPKLYGFATEPRDRRFKISFAPDVGKT